MFPKISSIIALQQITIDDPQEFYKSHSSSFLLLAMFEKLDYLSLISGRGNISECFSISIAVPFTNNDILNSATRLHENQRCANSTCLYH